MSKSTENSRPASKIAEKAAPYWARTKAAATSPTAKEIGKTVAVGAGVSVGLGIGYALFVKTAQVTYAAIS